METEWNGGYQDLRELFSGCTVMVRKGELAPEFLNVNNIVLCT